MFLYRSSNIIKSTNALARSAIIIMYFLGYLSAKMPAIGENIIAGRNVDVIISDNANSPFSFIVHQTNARVKNLSPTAEITLARKRFLKLGYIKIGFSLKFIINN